VLTAVKFTPELAQDEQLSETKNALVTEHLHLVKRIAQQILVSLPPSVDLDDLIQSGMVGLLEAADRYQNCHGASFATYAYYRIRGEIIDTIRDSVWMSRNTMRRLGHLEKVKEELARNAPDGKNPSARQIAEAAGVSTDEYFRALRDLRQSKELSLEECGSPGSGLAYPLPIDSTPSPEAELERDEILASLRWAISRLDADERELIDLYYREEWLLREIGDMRNISESRVCQIQKRIIARLRGLLKAEIPA